MPQDASGWTPVAEPSGWSPVSAPPDFQVANEKDASGNALVRGLSDTWSAANRPLIPQIATAAHAVADYLDQPRLNQSQIERYLRGFGAGIASETGDLAASFTSPVGIAMSLAGLGPESKLTELAPALKPLLELSAVKALQRAVTGVGSAVFGAQGAVKTATAKSPKDVAAGIGQAAAGAAGLAGTLPRPSLGSPPPTEAAAVQFGHEQGIPVDLATATGNRALRGVQHVANRSLAGSLIADSAEQARNTALTETGQRLAGQVHPEAVSPESAGEGVRSAITGLIGDLHQEATTAYGKLRAIEAQSPAEVAAPIPVDKMMLVRMRGTLNGKTASQGELQEMRNIANELDAVQYQAGKLVDEAPGVSSGSYYVPRTGNAAVYHDILQHAPGVSNITASNMKQAIRAAIDTGVFTNPAKGALEVAKLRLAGSRQVSSPILAAPGKATETTSMLLPVDVRSVKASVQPLYDRLKREAELVPLQGGKARTLTALDRLINGPDDAPVSVADEALSDLKSMARGADLPELRSVAQGHAALAVKSLDAAVRAAVAKAGPEATAALETGRAATVAKYAAADVLDTLKTEPVRSFKAATAPQDTAAVHLRQLAEMAPAELPKIGRAAVDEMLRTAGEAGGFDHADRLYANWQKFGPETKRLLFGSTAEDLGKFFLLAKKLSANPNPSGTAHNIILAGQVAEFAINPIQAVVSQVGLAGLAKLLNSPAVTKALTRSVSLTVGKAAPAVKASAWAGVLSAARGAGVPLGTMRSPAQAVDATDTPAPGAGTR